MTEGYFTNMATTKNTAAAESTEVLEDVTVPQQASKPEATNVTSIKKDSDVKFYGADDNDESETILDKVKGLAKNRKLIASVVTTTVLTAAVLVIRKRNSAVVEETDENPEA